MFVLSIKLCGFYSLVIQCVKGVECGVCISKSRKYVKETMKVESNIKEMLNG